MHLALETHSYLQSSHVVLQTAAAPRTPAAAAAAGGLRSVQALAACLVLCAAATSAAGRELAVACRHHLPLQIQTQLLFSTHPWRCCCCCYTRVAPPLLLLLPSCQTPLRQTLRHPLQRNSPGTVVQGRATGQGTMGCLCCHQMHWSRVSRSGAASAEPSAHPYLDSASLGGLQHDGIQHNRQVFARRLDSTDCSSRAKGRYRMGAG
jgi:hypothetical protein